MSNRSFMSFTHAHTLRPPAAPRRPAPPRPSPETLIQVADAASLIVAVGVAGRGTWLAFAFALGAFLSLLWTGSQRVRVNTAVATDVPWLLARLAVPMLLLAGLAVVFEAPVASLGRLAGTASIAAVLTPVGRAIAYTAIRVGRQRGRLSERVIVVGAGEVGVELAKVLREHREYGMMPAGFVDTVDTVGAVDGDGERPPILGGPETLAATVAREGATSVIIAFGAMSERMIAAALRACESLPVEVYVVPRLFEFGIVPAGLLADEVWGIPLIRLRRPALRPAAWATKRAFDVVVGGVALLVSTPLLAWAAAAVRRSSPGPPLLRQPRIGKGGRLFKLLKFRTMKVNGDSDTTWSVHGDGRVTPVGRFLRRTCIDELPQLVNVLRGEMSLVGPRPERPFFARRFADRVPGYDDRHRAPAGMTGWAQIHGLRGDTPIPDRVRFDNYYIEHWSPWLDVVILVRTAATVITNRQ
jgi:exopolysaccharide biosynthesis polyprenyl glycosylphosphotransferase